MALITAIALKLFAVHISVTIIAITLCIVFKFCAVWMTAITTLIRMLTLQGKPRPRMIKMGFVPRHRRMAITAWVGTKSVAMRILLGVTSSTSWLNGLVVTIDMALCAVNSRMPPFQWKSAHAVMIKSRVPSPKAFRLMTTIAINTFELTSMRILVTAVTTVTRRRPALPSMTVQTECTTMFAL